MLKEKIMASANENVKNVQQVVNGEIFTQEATQQEVKEGGEVVSPVVKTIESESLPDPANDNGKSSKTSDNEDDGPKYQTPEVVIDIAGVSAATGTPTQDLIPMFSGPQAVEIPMEIGALKNFITVQDGVAKTAAALSKNMCLPPEQRSLFLEKAQLFAGLALKGQAQLLIYLQTHLFC